MVLRRRGSINRIDPIGAAGLCKIGDVLVRKNGRWVEATTVNGQAHLIYFTSIVGCIEKIRRVREFRPADIVDIVDQGFTNAARFGGDKDHAVGALRAVNGSG